MPMSFPKGNKLAVVGLHGPNQVFYKDNSALRHRGWIFCPGAGLVSRAALPPAPTRASTLQTRPSADRRCIFRDRTNTTFTISALTSVSCGVTDESCFSCNPHLGCSSSSTVASSGLQSQVRLFLPFQSNYPLLLRKFYKAQVAGGRKRVF